MTGAVFDIIFAGGGTAACVIAGRLAAAEPSLKILVVESGQHSRDVPSHIQPCRFIEHLAQNTTTVSFHKAKPSAYLNGRSRDVPCGRVVGGGSAVNFMLYARGAASDYNDWAALGNKGWSFDEVLPLFKKLESFVPIQNRPTHGYSGPMQISPIRANLEIGSQLSNVAREYDPTRPIVDDANDFKTANAYGPTHRYIDQTTGRRCDAASRYLYPQTEKSNLEIIVGKQVKRVVIENGRAVGIEYIDTPGGGQPVTVKANKWVIVSAGAFGSPSILERSGVGSPSILGKNRIPVLVDLPGVGENYQDHISASSAYYATDELETMDELWTDPEKVKEHLEEWEKSGTGKIAQTGFQAFVKLRPSGVELESAGPELKKRWETFFSHHPDKPMATIVVFAGCLMAPSTSSDEKRIMPSYFLLYPELSGHVHITSGDDPNSPLDFDPEFLSKASDVEQLTLLYKFSRELFRRMPAYRGEIAEYHPKFPPGSAAACALTDGPVPVHAPNIAYSAADDEAIVNYHRDIASTTWHSLGTCAMKPRDQGGVVDSRLNVYGVQGLKVADMSICPTNVGNNTYSTALMIGEKAAVIVADELGIELL